MKTLLSAPGFVMALWLAGCASHHAPQAAPATSSEAARVRIEQRLAEIFDAAAKKDMRRLDSYHFYGPSFSKFSGGQGSRLDSETARQGEHAGLGAIEILSMNADELRIDLLGDAAVATFIMRYRFTLQAETVEKMERTTLVFVNDRGEWKIAHEHLSPFQK